MQVGAGENIVENQIVIIASENKQLHGFLQGYREHESWIHTVSLLLIVRGFSADSSGNWSESSEMSGMGCAVSSGVDNVWRLEANWESHPAQDQMRQCGLVSSSLLFLSNHCRPHQNKTLQALPIQLLLWFSDAQIHCIKNYSMASLFCVLYLVFECLSTLDIQHLAIQCHFLFVHYAAIYNKVLHWTLLLHYI